MEPLITAYHHGIQIQSLDLRALSIPADPFEIFLEALGTDPFLRRHLERLRFGSRWRTEFRDETGLVCEDMLETNNRLQYIHVFTSGSRAKPVHFGVSNFHHEWVVPRITNRLAFLSVLRRLLPIRPLSEESIANIFQFAATERKLMVEQLELPERRFMW